MKNPRQQRGRPRKPPEEKYETHSLKFPPSLWRKLEELVPPGERSAVIHQALVRELNRRRRQAVKQSVLSAAALAAPTAGMEGAEDDPWRRAAEQAREYYQTDPEAVEWAMFAGDALDE